MGRMQKWGFDPWTRVLQTNRALEWQKHSPTGAESKMNTRRHECSPLPFICEHLSSCRSGSDFTMADPLSVTASVVGITTAALQSVQFLAKTIGDIKDVPDIVKSIRADLQAIEPVLRNLNKALQGDDSQIVLSDQIKPAVENYDRACTTFKSLLDHWTRHSKERTFWIDRWRVGLFGQERIRSFKAQLSDYKGTLSVALSTATMYRFSLGTNVRSLN